MDDGGGTRGSLKGLEAIRLAYEQTSRRSTDDDDIIIEDNIGTLFRKQRVSPNAARRRHKSLKSTAQEGSSSCVDPRVVDEHASRHSASSNWLKKGIAVKVLRGPFKGVTGTVQYKGMVQFARGMWVGIETFEPVGQHDGTVQQVPYFRCTDKHGIFIQARLLAPVSISPSSSSRRLRRQQQSLSLRAGSPQTHESVQLPTNEKQYKSIMALWRLQKKKRRRSNSRHVSMSHEDVERVQEAHMKLHMSQQDLSRPEEEQVAEETAAVIAAVSPTSAIGHQSIATTVSEPMSSVSDVSVVDSGGGPLPTHDDAAHPTHGRPVGASWFSFWSSYVRLKSRTRRFNSAPTFVVDDEFSCSGVSMSPQEIAAENEALRHLSRLSLNDATMSSGGECILKLLNSEGQYYKALSVFRQRIIGTLKVEDVAHHLNVEVDLLRGALNSFIMITNFHKFFMDSCNEDPSSISNCFLTNMENLREVYCNYYENFELLMTVFKHLTLSSYVQHFVKQFTEFQDMESVDLCSFVMLPIKRLSAYAESLGKLMHKVHPTLPSFAEITEAYERLLKLKETLCVFLEVLRETYQTNQ